MSKKKYKKIWLEDEEGNIEFGGIKEDSEHIKLVKELNDEVLRKIKHKNQTDYWFKEFGGYIHMSYTRNQLLFNELNISRPNISRIIYLATYIEYNYKEENLLVRKRANINNTKHLNKKDLKKLLKLSPNAFREFIKEMKELNLLYEVEDKFYLTDEYFSKGKCNFNKGEYARIFIKTTQMLYENCSPRQHKQLAYVYQLLPFLNFDTKYSYFRSQLIKNDTAESSTITKLDDFLNINLYNEITYENKRNEIPLTTIFNNYMDEMIKNGFLSLTKNKKINITETMKDFDAQFFGVIIVKSIINNYPLKYKIAPLLLKMLSY